MPIFDDERFEHYLSQFRPVAADPLPIERRSPAIRRRSWMFAFSAATALAALIVLVFVVRVHRKPGGSTTVKGPATATVIEQLANSQPLTLQRANDLLARAPSFKAALDGVAFQRQPSKLPQGSRSALATLGKEDIKL